MRGIRQFARVFLSETSTSSSSSILSPLSHDSSRILSHFSSSVAPASNDSAPSTPSQPSTSKALPRPLDVHYKQRDIYGGKQAIPYVRGTETSPASIVYQNPFFRALPGGRITPLSVRKWVRRKKGPFSPKRRLYSMGMNVMPLLGAESLPESSQVIADRAAAEGRELTTRERIYSLLLDQRAKQLRPEYTIRETLAPQTEEIKVADKEVFAVVEIKGYQHKVHPDDVLYTQKVEEWKVNDVVELNQVLLLGSKYESLIGRPYLPDAKVVCLVEEKFKDAHQLHLRKKKRHNRHKKLIGFRRELVKLRVLEVQGIEAVPRGQKEVEVPRKPLGPEPAPRVPKHMRNYIRIAENLYADPKSFRYIGLKNGLVMADRLRKRREALAAAAGKDEGQLKAPSTE